MMTAPPRPQQAPVRQPEHSDWEHGPVAAAINASLVSALLAAVMRLTHLPAGLALLVGVVMAASLVAAGNMRKPRRLALRSIVYRGAAMLTAGVWLWLTTANFAQVGAGAVTGMVFAGIGLTGVAGIILCLRTGHRLFSLICGGVALIGLGGGVATMALAHVFAVFGTAAPLTRTNCLPWLGHSAVSLVILAAVFAVVGAVCANHEAELDDTLQRALLMRSHGREMLMMQNLLRNAVRAPGLSVTRFSRWDNGAGEDYQIDGTVDGVTPDDINRQKDTLAAKLNLDNGCGVEAIQGTSRGRIIVAVSRVNRIKDGHVYPPQYKQRSIYNGLPIGVLRDGTEVAVKLRESSAFVFGQKRSGKTTTLYDIAAGVMQCTDALLWVIDFGGGGVALPFLYPFAEGKMKTPAVDWVATTVDEAKKMADLALAIALDRKIFYKHRKRKASTNLLPLDSEVPEIIIMIDEGAEAMGETAGMDYDAKEVRGTLEKIVRVAGDSGVNIVFSGLAATQEVIDRMTLAQLSIRIGMRVTESRELAYGFDQDYGLNPADIPYQGSGYVKASHEEGTRVFKAYLLEPNQMGEIALATEHWRPGLDARAVELGGSTYRSRWARTQHLLTDENGNVLIDVGQVGTAVMDRPDDSDDDGYDDDAQHGPVTAQPKQALGPMPPDAPVDPPSRTPIDRSGVDIQAGLRPFIVPGSPDDLINRADQSAARLSDAANAAGGGNDKEDGLDDAAVNARFAALARREFDWRDASQWPETPAPSGVETSNNPHGPAVLEALVRSSGADGILAKDIKDKLKLGGPWGPPIVVTDQTIHEWLKSASWLAPRRQRTPYVHSSFGQPGSAV